MAERERSRAYPVFGLKEAEQSASALLRKLGSDPQSRQTLIEALGYQSTEGGIAARKVAAFVQFGLFSRSKGKYAPNELVQSLVRPRSPEERGMALRYAFEHPPLFRDLLSKFRSQGHVPTHLPNILIRDYRIYPAVAERVDRIFLESGRYAGVLNTDRSFAEAVHTPGLQVASHQALAEQADGLRLDEVGARDPTVAAAAALPGLKWFVVPLSRGPARIGVPGELNHQDLDLLRRQVEALEALKVEGR